MNPKLVGQCFVVHGRLTLANGNPSVRIWQVGTKHMLGALDSNGNDIDDIDKFPRQIRPLIPKDPWQMEIFGDYTVCPFTHERAGWMQFVCIASARHLVARNRMEPDTKP